MKRIFISYSRLDKSALSELESHLAGLKRNGQIEIWYDDKDLSPGGLFEYEIIKNIQKSQIFICILSNNSLKTDFIWKKEIPIAIELEQQQKLKIIPILYSNCDFQSTALSKSNIIPTKRRAINNPLEWATKDDAWLYIVNEIKKEIKQLSDDEIEQKLNENLSNYGFKDEKLSLKDYKNIAYRFYTDFNLSSQKCFEKFSNLWKKNFKNSIGIDWDDSNDENKKIIFLKSNAGAVFEPSKLISSSGYQKKESDKYTIVFITNFDEAIKVITIKNEETTLFIIEECLEIAYKDNVFSLICSGEEKLNEFSEKLNKKFPNTHILHFPKKL